MVLQARKGVLQITEKVKHILSHEEVRNIFNETYNVFYKKWRNISNPDDWPKLMQEMYEIDAKYDCDLCRQILLELVKVMQDEFLKRQGEK
ncbi:MAG TPA: hypothetical protein DDY59_10645 [Lachnospiraceae bacterium]|jgi:hypothetical protein|nr:hypothetical protein [Lachnospiraceae bacterium]HCA69351.1 hypothetical protein [Lachnospiraceae bacterium]